MKWGNGSPGTSVVSTAETVDGRRFSILPNQQYDFQPVRGYLLYDEKSLHLLSKEGKPLLGLGTFCAIGAPRSAVFKSVQDAQRTAEKVVSRT